MTAQRHASSPDRETSRLEAFSDGVFAIAITLLILNIHVQPTRHQTLGEAILSQWPSYLAFLLSFLTILNLWANHHNIFRYIFKCKSLGAVI